MPARKRQSYQEARWTKKHGTAHFGYKNLISINWRRKLVRRYAVSSAAVHDSQKLDKLALATAGCRAPTTPPAGCGSIEPIAAKRPKRSSPSATSRAISTDAVACNKPLTVREEPANKARSNVRARV